MRLIARLSLIACLLALAGPGAASAFVVPSQSPSTIAVPNGSVDALAANGDTLYMGGDFSQVGPLTGPGIAVDISTGARSAGFPVLNGVVYDSVGDGNGGWYVAGEFDHAGAAQTGFVTHLLADGSVDPGFNSPVGYAPAALALDAAGNRLYVGGSFGTVSGAGSGSAHLVRLNATTGAPDTSWKPAPNGDVRALALDSANGRLYVGGSFSSIGHTPLARVGLALLHTADDDADAGFAADLTSGGSNSSAQTVVLGSSYLYIAGSFDKVGAAAHVQLAQLNPVTGTAGAWAPAPDGYTGGVAPDDANGKVYLGGQFVNVGGIARRGLARVNNTDGSADASWRADTPAYPGNSSASLDAADLRLVGSTLYAVGQFTSIDTGAGAVARNGAAAVDTSGTLLGWDPNLGVNPQAGYRASNVSVQGAHAFVGGNFPIAGGSPRRGLAAIDARSGTLLPFAPVLDAFVNSLAVAGGKLYVGGGFSAADGHSTPRVAAFDLATGAVDSGFTAPALNGVTYALLPDGGRVYAGLMSGSAGLVALDSATGAAVPGFTSPIGSGGVRALASDGTRLYAGGPFTGVAGHDFLVALDAAGAVDPGFAPALSGSASPAVKALLLSSGRLYAGGRFASPRGDLAAFDPASGAWLSGWTPPWFSYPSSLGVLSLFRFDGNVWATGDPTSIGPTPATGDGGLGILDPASGAPASGFYPGFDQEVEASAVAAGRFFAGGAFTTLGFPGKPYVGNLAAFDFPAPVATTAPELSGLPGSGHSLACSDGVWSNEPTQFAKSWLRDGAPIAGAHASSYTIDAGDVGHVLKCEVTATAASGARGSAASPALAVPPPFGGGGTPPAGSGPDPGSGLTPSDTTPLDLRLFFELRDVKKLTLNPRGRVRVPVGCYELNGCSGTLTIVTRPSKHKPSRTLARVDFKDIRDLTFVRVTLTKAGMRAFGRAKSLKVLVKVTVRDRAGNRASLQLPYTLRR